MHFFDRAYEGDPPWEIGRPQPAYVRLEERGEIQGRVLDVGCGTGENALFFAGRGHDTVGIDFAPRAIGRASEKAQARASSVRFQVGSALELESLHLTFDTVTDCGMFHTFLDEHRPVYARNVASVLRPGGRLFVLCFSEMEPADWGGPRRVTREELRSTFQDGWSVRWIHEDRFDTNFSGVQGRAWLAAFERTSSGRSVRPRARSGKRPGRRTPARSSTAPSSSAGPT